MGLDSPGYFPLENLRLIVDTELNSFDNKPTMGTWTEILPVNMLGIRDGALQISLLRFRHAIVIHNLFEENLSSTMQEMCFQKEKSQD